MDWSQWSREAVEMMEARNAAWPKRYGLEGAAYRWDLDTAEVVFTRDDREARAALCIVGTLARDGEIFEWAWADAALPHLATYRLKLVKDFGAANDLSLLLTPQLQGGHSQALEALCIAGRILDAAGVFIDRSDETGYYFTLHALRSRP